MDTISPDDLQMLRTAHQEAARAQQARQQAEAAHLGALGAAQFAARQVTERYQLGPADRVDLETGAITRGVNGEASGATIPPGIDSQAMQKQRRKSSK